MGTKTRTNSKQEDVERGVSPVPEREPPTVVKPATHKPSGNFRNVNETSRVDTFKNVSIFT